MLQCTLGINIVLVAENKSSKLKSLGYQNFFVLSKVALRLIILSYSNIKKWPQYILFSFNNL